MIRTKNYLLESFLTGDSYSSTADHRRFSTVDNQMFRVSEIIGDGRIDGWEIQGNYPNIKLTAGSGFVDKFFVNTYDDKILNLSLNDTYYIFAQRRIGIVGNNGPRSDVQSIEYTDYDAPGNPSNLTVVSNDPFQVELNWDDNTEDDFDHYEIERSSNGSEFSLIATVSQSIYEDIVDEDSNYDYKVYSIDKSSNRSSGSEISITTALSSVAPSNPLDVQFIASEGAINVLWKDPPSTPYNKIDHYELEIVELDSDNSEIVNSKTIFIVNKTLLYFRFSDLKTEQSYRVTIRTIDSKSRESTGVSGNILTLMSAAPQDPESINYNIVEIQSGIQVNLSWNDGDNPYDPAISYRYKIYVTVDGQRESLAINVPVGISEEQVSLYTFNLVEYFSIPENSIITFRITSVDNSGFESFGNFIRIKTNLVTLPLRLRDLVSEFNFNNAYLNVTWRNQPDTHYVNIRILKDDLSDPYIYNEEIINENIGKSEKYVLTEGELNVKYTIIVTPYNLENISGNSSTVIELTNIPGGLPLPDQPAFLETKINDREVKITWNDSLSPYIAFHKIYKKTGGITLDFNQWQLIDTVPYTVNTFYDYGLENDETYSYYITSVDIYNRESLHLSSGSVNLNFVEIIPIASGNLTAPEITSITLNSSNEVVINWTSLLEEFDAFSLYRSNGNLHNWELVTTLDRNATSYTDISFPLINGTIFYYTIAKSINDSDIVVQTVSTAPQNSIFLAKVILNEADIESIDVANRRDIKDLIDPLTESTNRFLLNHKHRDIRKDDPERINLSTELIITDWTTVDGRIFLTQETDMNGTSFIVRIDGRFPSVFYTVDSINRRLIFSEPIVTIDPNTGQILGQIPTIEVKVLGVEEVDSVLGNNRFSNIHAKQVQFGTLNLEQIPEINHEGRIREELIPKRFLLEKYNNFNYIVPQLNTDSTKNFGDGTAFYCTKASDGQIDSIYDFDLFDDGSLVGFNKPAFSDTTINNLKSSRVSDVITESDNYSNDYIFNTNKVYISTTTQFFSLDKNTLSSHIISNTSLSDCRSMTYDSLNNKSYLMTSAVGNSNLRIFDIGNGSIFSSVAVSAGADRIIRDIEYNSNNNTLYCVIQNTSVSPSTHELATINVNSGLITIIGTMDTQSGGTEVHLHLTFDEVNNIMYGANSSTDATDSRLFTVDVSTGVTSAIGSSGITSGIAGITFDYDSFGSNKIIGVTSTQLCYLNISTGAATVIGSHLITDPRSIVAAPFDQSFYITNPLAGSSEIRLGNFYGFSSSTFLRFAVNIEKNYSIINAILQFTPAGDFSNNVRYVISALNPNVYGDSVDLSLESMKQIETFGNTFWAPADWIDGDTENASVDISDIVQSFVDKTSFFNGRHIIIKIETVSTTDIGENRIAEIDPELTINYATSVAKVVSDPTGFQSEKCYHLGFEFADNTNTRWVRISTNDTDFKPNVVIDLEKRIRFRILTEKSIYLCLGIREKELTNKTVGDDGGNSGGSIEWVGINSTIKNDEDNLVPIGTLITGSGDWQEIDIDLKKTSVINFENGNSSLSLGLGILDHIAFTISSDSGHFDIYIDEVQQVSDVLVAGTSQGIQLSRDFGRSWTLSRLTDTPVFKFLKANNNKYFWALSPSQVLLATDPAFWFVSQGTTGIQYIHDIVEDLDGNMFISCEKGVYKLDISLINHYNFFSQTKPVNAFTTDCYALYNNSQDSGSGEIWVSTEIGIYKTQDGGNSWSDSGMKTGGLVAHQIFNIGSSSVPTIIAVTNKCILRKLHNESNFQIIADFEDQHNLASIQKAEYCNGRLYVSTASGVYMNTESTLFTPGINSVSFEKVFPGLNINNTEAIAFGLDAVVIDNVTEQLFIGQENRLLMADHENVLSIKKSYRNKELPTFYINDEELKFGYFYNAFNNILCVRQPMSVVDIVSSSNLPRKGYFAKNSGWAQTNPSAEVFIYKNGFPTWLDWSLDETAILGEIQIIQGQLRSLNALNTFNSLYPESQTYLDKLLSDITIINSGGENNSSLVNNDTITKFLEDYFKLLSLLTNQFKLNNTIDFPEIILSGIPRNERINGSRADILEEKEDFESEETTLITIDTLTGYVDFLQAFAVATDPNRRNLLTFNKYDKLEITIFNSNIKNTGEFTHRELEDKMEDLNTGLTSNLQVSVVSNLIKSGIQLERRYNHIFDRHPVQNIQSRFYGAYTNDFYDIVNSTVDYETIIKIDNLKQSRFVNVLKTIETDDPYFGSIIWVGTDHNIMEFLVNSDGILKLNNVIKINNLNFFIWDIYKYQDTIYIVCQDQNKKCHIYSTVDREEWIKIDTINLPEKIYSIRILNGNVIATTDEGVFYSDNSFDSWFKGDIVLSRNMSSDSESVSAFSKRFSNVFQNNIFIGESNRWFYSSSQGVEYLSLGRISNNSCSVVNKIIRFKNINFIATDKGLYNDGNSMLSETIQFGLEIIEEDLNSSINLAINDIVKDDNALYCGSSNGKIYRFFNNAWKRYLVPNFGPIHKMEILDNYLIITSYNVIQAINITPETGVFE